MSSLSPAVVTSVQEAAGVKLKVSSSRGTTLV
jgi:hypothetical protein